SLLHRLDGIYETIGGDYENYFNNIEYFDCRARFHELKGEFAESIWYTNLAKPLKDSLARRNDARHLEQLKQRLEAEKYAKKIRLMEQEREFQEWLRNISFVILALVLVVAFFYFRRLHRHRQEQLAELNLAKKI
ncbi:MAG: hypothetical protein AAGD05_10450, partial [Bacteroidota bacterium]